MNKSIVIIILVTLLNCFASLANTNIKAEQQTQQSSEPHELFHQNSLGFHDPLSWDPFREFDHYKKRLLEMYQHPSTNIGTPNAFYSPQLDFEQFEDHYLVEVDLPGLNKESINIEIKNNFLTVSGERENKRESKNDQGFYRSEISYGAFQRTITLPKDASNEGIDADYKNGVLEIKIPRLKENNQEKRLIKIN